MLSLHRTIREIPAEEWNSLAGGNAFAAHGWLLTIETCWRTGIEPLYFTLRRGGALVAASVCYATSHTAENETLDNMLFGRLTSLFGAVGLSYLPAIVCGPALGYGWHIGVSGNLKANAASEARGEVLDAIETEARSRGLKVHFVQLLDEEREMAALLRARGYLRCRNAPVAVLDVKWSSFKDYLAALPAGRRTEIRRQIRRNRDSGNVIELLDSPSHEDSRLLELVDMNTRRYNSYPFAFGPGFFETLKANLGDDAWLLIARRSGTIAGVCAAVERKGALFPFVVGVDHDVEGKHYNYFQLAYYSMQERAIALGIKRMYYGRGMYQLKLRRGCRLMGNWTYSSQPGALRPVSAIWFAVASAWNRYKLPRRVRRALPRSG